MPCTGLWCIELGYSDDDSVCVPMSGGFDELFLSSSGI